MDIRTALKQGLAQLRAANVSSHTLAAELLLLHATGRTRTSLYSHPEDQLTGSESQNYFSLIERRAAGVPTQHLTGKQEFWGLEFEVTPDVLIPRPETEHVIEVALDRLALRDLRAEKSQIMSGEGLFVADVGTGSGCIAMALAKELPGAKIYALDISLAALTVARRNANRLGFANRVTFLESNLFERLSLVGAQQAALQLGELRALPIPTGISNRPSQVTALRSDRQQSSLHRATRSGNSCERGTRPRTCNRSLRRRRRLRILCRPHHAIRLQSKTWRRPGPRTRSRFSPRRTTATRHANMDGHRRHQRPRHHPSRDCGRKSLSS